MRIITIERRKLKMIKYILLIILLFIIILVAYNLFTRNQPVSSIEKNFAQYININETFSFDYPYGWEMQEEEFYKEEILYNINFSHHEEKAYGIVQIWETDKKIADIIENMEQSPIKGNIEIIDKKQVRVNEYRGYLIEYVSERDTLEIYKVKEVFLEGENRIFRFGLSTKENQWNEEYEKMFVSIAKSIKFK